MSAVCALRREMAMGARLRLFQFIPLSSFCSIHVVPALNTSITYGLELGEIP